MSKSSQKPQKNLSAKEGIRNKCLYNFMRALFLVGILSLISEIMSSRSIFANIIGSLESCSLFQKTFPKFALDCFRSLPSILHANVIFEIVKILGFGSILISMIQTLMDKKTFGISYADIIEKKYDNFTEIFVIHLLSTIMCIGFSAAGASEGALITLLVMLLGFSYFGIIIHNLLFCTEIREKHAISILNEALSKQVENKDSLLGMVQTLAKEVSQNLNYEKDNLMSCFAYALLLYCNQASNAADPFGRISIIKDAAVTWGMALPQNSEAKQARFVGKVIVVGLL